jgi:SAM-dependent methyltransferase
MTPDIHSTDYHDFVFRDGKLVGEFDQMYRNSADVPWHQDDAERRLDCRVAATVLQHHGPFDSVLEAGAGLGFFADLLWRALNPRSMTGTDISPEAVRRARARFPHIAFEEMDLMTPGADAGRRYDLVVIRGCFWYLFPKLDVAVANLTSLTARGGGLFVAQNFPPLDKPFVGKRVIPNPDVLVARFTPAFDLVAKLYIESQVPDNPNDSWILFLGRKR